MTSRYFLRYMNEGLDLYEDQPDVICIHGYVYPGKQSLPETFLLKGADCWGWATWRRGWELFRTDGATLLEELERTALIREFDFDGTFPFSQMLRDQISGRNDSWAIRWYASAFLSNKLTLYPGRSLVHNIGNDSSGIHCEPSTFFDVQVSDAPVTLAKLPSQQNERARVAFMRRMRGIEQRKSSQLPRPFRRFLQSCRRIFQRCRL